MPKLLKQIKQTKLILYVPILIDARNCPLTLSLAFSANSGHLFY